MRAKTDQMTEGKGSGVLIVALGLSLVWSTGCTQSPDSESTNRSPDTTSSSALQNASPDSSAPIVQAPAHKGYDFSIPDAEFKLDKDLVEISGLTVFDDGHLAAVEDEHGRFYVLDIQTGDITEAHRFAGKDDYEGIEMAHERLYVLRSDGQLREVTGYDTDEPDSDRIKTHLGSHCDSEGLAFDAKHNRLLIACKEHPGKGLKRQRAIYGFDLEHMELTESPVYTIPIDEVDLNEGSTLDNAVKNFVYPLVDLDGFKPSALAIHPLTGELFVLSSVLKVVVVLSDDGSINAVLRLDEDLLEQPEGLAFLPNGDLFISSEGRKKKARLVRYNYKLSQ